MSCCNMGNRFFCCCLGGDGICSLMYSIDYWWKNLVGSLLPFMSCDYFISWRSLTRTCKSCGMNHRVWIMYMMHWLKHNKYITWSNKNGYRDLLIVGICCQLSTQNLWF